MCNQRFTVYDVYVFVILVYFQLIESKDTGRKTSAAKARGFLKVLLSKDGCLFAHFQLDVLNILPDVSYAFQKVDATVGDVLYEIEAAVENLLKMKEG